MLWVLIKAGLWKYQILLLAHEQVDCDHLLVQVNGQNPLVQPKFTCPKIGNFSYFSKKTYVVGTH